MATTAGDSAAATVNEAGVTGYVQDGDKWVVVEGDKLVEAATAVVQNAGHVLQPNP